MTEVSRVFNIMGEVNNQVIFTLLGLLGFPGVPGQFIFYLIQLFFHIIFY